MWVYLVGIMNNEGFANQSANALIDPKNRVQLLFFEPFDDIHVLYDVKRFATDSGNGRLLEQLLYVLEAWLI